MRTTVVLDQDVLRAVEQLRRSEGLGLSEAVNLLARRGLHSPAPPHAFTQSTSSLGPPRIPIDDVAAALDVLEGEAHR
jgi:hypothetical protein